MDGGTTVDNFQMFQNDVRNVMHKMNKTHDHE